jgi:hypothetical protein
VILSGFTLERREDGPLLQPAHLALVFAALSRCGGLWGRLAGRRRRGPEGLRAAGGARARNVSRKPRPVIGGSCAAFGPASSSRGARLGSGGQPRPGALCAPLIDSEETPHHSGSAAQPLSRSMPKVVTGHEPCGQLKITQVVRAVWLPSMPHLSARARTMSRPW